MHLLDHLGTFLHVDLSLELLQLSRLRSTVVNERRLICALLCAIGCLNRRLTSARAALDSPLLSRSII